MTSNRWQRTQTIILHIALAFAVALPLFIFEMPLIIWAKCGIIFVGYAIIIPFFRWLHRKYAVTFIKVFKRDYLVSARIVQRTLNRNNLPFTKRTVVNDQGDEEIVFDIRRGKMRLVVADFMLNLMVDDHLKPEIGTMLKLDRETNENAADMRRLRVLLDEAFAYAY